jgi:phenylacetic acid degradation operon negative regulatory protein
LSTGDFYRIALGRLQPSLRHSASELGDTRSMAERAERQRSGRSGKDLLLTILGEFVLPGGGAVWTSSLIEALSLVDVGEANARQAAARLVEDGFLTTARFGRASRWTLTSRGEQLLTSGAMRIYEFGSSPTSWDGSWVIALTSIPEELRTKRHHLRSGLGFAGFGFLNAGTAISPHTDRAGEAMSILAGLELDPSALVFVAQSFGGASNAEIIRRAWDLNELAAKYNSFIADHSRLRPVGGAARFAALVRLVHEWRRFPFEDPEIPAVLLPKRWPGPRAKKLFDDRRNTWGGDAQRWFQELESM